MFKKKLLLCPYLINAWYSFCFCFNFLTDLFKISVDLKTNQSKKRDRENVNYLKRCSGPECAYLTWFLSTLPCFWCARICPIPHRRFLQRFKLWASVNDVTNTCLTSHERNFLVATMGYKNFIAKSWGEKKKIIRAGEKIAFLADDRRTVKSFKHKEARQSKLHTKQGRKQSLLVVSGEAGGSGHCSCFGCSENNGKKNTFFSINLNWVRVRGWSQGTPKKKQKNKGAETGRQPYTVYKHGKANNKRETSVKAAIFLEFCSSRERQQMG